MPVDLNIYLTTAGAYLGWAYFPSSYKTKPWINDIVVDLGVHVPNVHRVQGRVRPRQDGHARNGALGRPVPVFQGGCNNYGDYVDDTPPQLIATRGCPEGRQLQGARVSTRTTTTWTTRTTCYDQFTAGQTVPGMQDQWNFFRADGGFTVQSAHHGGAARSRPATFLQQQLRAARLARVAALSVASTQKRYCPARSPAARARRRTGRSRARPPSAAASPGSRTARTASRRRARPPAPSPLLSETRSGLRLLPELRARRERAGGRRALVSRLRRERVPHRVHPAFAVFLARPPSRREPPRARVAGARDLSSSLTYTPNPDGIAITSGPVRMPLNSEARKRAYVAGSLKSCGTAPRSNSFQMAATLIGRACARAASVACWSCDEWLVRLLEGSEDVGEVEDVAGGIAVRENRWQQEEHGQRDDEVIPHRRTILIR